jgi:EamA domain-containing membrane protein RarD
MNDSQRKLLFWLLLLSSPLVSFLLAKSLFGNDIRELGFLALLIAIIGAAFYIRAGRSKK